MVKIARRSRIGWAAALASATTLVLGCNSILGYESDYALDNDASAVGTGGTGGVAGQAGTGGDASVEADAKGGNAGDSSVEGDVSSDVLDCDAGGVAIGSIGQACCTANALACAGHAQKVVLICNPTGMQWAALQACSGNQLCDTTPGPNAGSCQEPVPSCIGKQPGDKICDGDTSVECGPDLVTSTPSVCQYACKDGVCTGGCKSGDKQCDGLAPQTCDAQGEWQNGAPCAYVCKAAECSGVCSPQSVQCAGKTPQSCDGNGQWQDGTPCTNVCTGGVCAGACTPNQTQCNGNMVQTCDSGGVWQDGEACPYVCLTGACTGVCSPGTTQCAGLLPQTCDAKGKWQSGSTCPFVCNGGVCAGQCTPGGKQCTGLVPQTCGADGVWASGAACTYVCSSGACTGVCSPGDAQCSGLVPQSCDSSGQWQSATTCQYVCTAGTCAGGCTPGNKQCNGVVPQTCNTGGSWDNGAACAHVCSSGICTGVCTPGAHQCTGLVPQTCDSSGQWQSGSTCPYLCTGGACTGSCAPGSKQCVGTTGQTCKSDGTWDAGVACGVPTPVCQSGVCVGDYGPSCATLAATCGPSGNASCCAAIALTGGTFYRGYDAVTNTDMIYPATVSGFRLDTYEATVGRFRKYVAAYPGNKPAAGAGKNPHNSLDTGWDIAWNALMPADQAALISKLKSASTCAEFTWTDTAGGKETSPINCVSWFEAFAFCIWDGGRLPSEAEWNFAAAGGGDASGQRVYPWSVPSISTTISSSYAVYNNVAHPAGVGSKSPLGDGRWGHADLAGNVWEWVRDKHNPGNYNDYPLPCQDCANDLPSLTERVFRGGGFYGTPIELQASDRNSDTPTQRDDGYGVRCARDM